VRYSGLVSMGKVIGLERSPMDTVSGMEWSEEREPLNCSIASPHFDGILWALNDVTTSAKQLLKQENSRGWKDWLSPAKIVLTTQKKDGVAMRRRSHLSPTIYKEDYDIGIYWVICGDIELIPCEFRTLDMFCKIRGDLFMLGRCRVVLWVAFCYSTERSAWYRMPFLNPCLSDCINMVSRWREVRGFTAPRPATLVTISIDDKHSLVISTHNGVGPID
jgi:hypothetical protein